MAESEKAHWVVTVGAGFNGARELVQLVGATTEVPSIEQTRGSGERPLAVGCGEILARKLVRLIPLRGGVLSGWCQHP